MDPYRGQPRAAIIETTFDGARQTSVYVVAGVAFAFIVAPGVRDVSGPAGWGIGAGFGVFVGIFGHAPWSVPTTEIPNACVLVALLKELKLTANEHQS